MSALALRDTSIPAFRPARLIARLREDEPRFYTLGVFLFVAVAPLAFAALVDERTFLGVDVWTKPLKFAFALSVYLLSLAFYARWLPAGLSSRRWYRIYSGAVVAAIVLEMIWIGGASLLGTASHFNATPFGAVVYSFMGVAAVLLTSASAVFAFQIARNRDTALAPALKAAIVLGLALVLPLTLITAGTMSGMQGHFVGGAASDAGGLALIGWARDGGDLRVAHFFSTHAMHFVPAFGLVTALIFGDARRAPVLLFGVAYCGLVAFAFVQALMGQPFLPMLGGE